MDIFQRPPSTGWEPIPLPETPETPAFAWFRPASIPTGIVFHLPASPPDSKPLSLRRILELTGIDARLVLSWAVQGQSFPGLQGTNPLLQEPLPPPRPGIDPSVIVIVAAPVPLSPPIAPIPVAAPAPPAAPPPSTDHNSGSLFAAIESDWNAIRQLEAQLAGQRKQLNGLFARLQSLNRDMTPEEKRAADNQDNREWQDVRRWLRDTIAVASRAIRAYDIGVTSAAGNRNRFEDFYTNFVKSRRPTGDLSGWALQFESHRKTVQSLQVELNAALTNCGRDGEQRAQQFLSRIAAKIRRSRTVR
jgi:hypothetical protein